MHVVELVLLTRQRRVFEYLEVLRIGHVKTVNYHLSMFTPAYINIIEDGRLSNSPQSFTVSLNPVTPRTFHTSDKINQTA